MYVPYASLDEPIIRNMGSLIEQLWPADLRPEKDPSGGPFSDPDEDAEYPRVVGCDNDAGLLHSSNVSERNWEELHLHTDFFVCNGFSRLDPRVQVELPAGGLSLDEQTVCRVLCVLLLHHSELRVRFSVLPGSSMVLYENQLVCEINISLRFLDKLRQANTAPQEPTHFRVMLIRHPEYDPHRDCMKEAVIFIRAGQCHYHATEFAAILAEQQTRLDIKTAEACTGQHASDAFEAVTLINKAICARITQQRIDNTKPMHPDIFTLPKEVRELIWHFSIEPSDTNLYITPYRYMETADESNCRGYPNPSVPFVNDHLLVSHAHADEVRTHLYGTRIWHFNSPCLLQTFLQRTQPDVLRRIRRFELHFDPDAWLAFLQPSLPFIYTRSTPSFTIESFLRKINSTRHPGFTLTLRFPPRHQMKSLAFEGRCHLCLCKWIVKASQTAVKDYPAIQQRLQYASDLADKRRTACKRQVRREMRQIFAFKDELDQHHWSELLDEEFSDPRVAILERDGPPLCTHPGGHPYKAERGPKPNKPVKRIRPPPRQLQPWEPRDPLPESPRESLEIQQTNDSEHPEAGGADGYSSASEESEPEIIHW